MTTLITKGFNSSDLVKVIKACKSSGVTYVKLADLELRFNEDHLPQIKNNADNHNIETTIPVENLDQLQELEQAELDDYHAIIDAEEFELSKLEGESNNE